MREYVTVSNAPMGEWLGEIAILHHDQVLGRTREGTRANLPFLERVIGLDKGTPTSRYFRQRCLMFRKCSYAFSSLAMVTALALPGAGQSVISARSGVIHFFEGLVYLHDQPLEPHPGKFQMLAQGDELRTAQGSAEVLLTPGVFLRIGEKSAIRMVANNLADTRVELLAGSAMVSSDEPNANTSVTLICRKWKVHFLREGAYRIDSEPPRLWVEQGKAEVSAEGTASPVSVEQGMDLPLAALVPEPSTNEPADELSNWSKGRSQSISTDNAIAAKISDDPTAAGNSDLAAGTLTYFPLLGLPAVGLGFSRPYSSYNSFAPYQPGFNSIYLPGYTYQPFILGLLTVGHRPFPGSAVPHVPYPRPTPIRPVPHPIGGGHPVGGHPVGVHPIHR